MKKLVFLTLVSIMATPAFSNDRDINQLADSLRALAVDSKVLPTLNEDVVSAFDLNGEYNSPLKRANFRKTEQYAEYHRSLVSKKTDMLRKNWHTVLLDTSNSPALLQPYNLEKKGFVAYLADGSFGRIYKSGHPCNLNPLVNEAIIFSNLHVECGVEDKNYNGREKLDHVLG